MYLQYFGLKQEPFSIAPDPRFLFMSERHREALAHLRFGLMSGGGFVVLSGEIGAGKTTVCRLMLEKVPRRVNVAYIFNPKLTVRELLQSVCHDFHIPNPREPANTASIKDYIDALNDYLLRTHAVGQHNVLIVDEAQALPAELLEQLRLLTNLETHERKLLQIVLIGQPELRDMLARPELEQLAQRVVARFHLGPLSSRETEQYVRHRLAVAGMGGTIPFDDDAIKRMHALSQGVPRRINLLADRALLGAYAKGTVRVRRAMVDQAAREVFGDAMTGGAWWARLRSRRGLALAGAAAAGLAVLGGGLWWAQARPGAASPAAAASAAAAPTASATAASVAGPPTSGTALAAVAAPMADGAALSGLLPAAPADEAQGWRELAAAWTPAPLAGEPCAALRAQGVHCFKRRGTLPLLRQLARPALLPLYGADGVARYAQLVGLAADGTARLRIGGRTVRVAPQVLETAWRGEFGTLWRAHPGFKAQSASATGAAVVSAGVDEGWLAAQLARWPDAAAWPAASAGERALRQQVLAFQRAQGLEADGQAGALTLMQLNRLGGIDEPRIAD